MDDNVQGEDEISSKIAELKSELRRVRKQKMNLLKAKARQEGRISRLFKPDQLQALSRVNMKGVHWSSGTVKKAFQLRFACGPSGYNVLLKHQYPLPSARTLQRRLQNISFEPGVLTNVFDMLEVKVKEMNDNEKNCCLTLDELSLSPGVEYDASSGKLLGNVTLPQHTGRANHALVFMLGGISTRWKQTVAFHYTNLQTDGTVFRNIVLDIIHRAAAIGLHVKAVTCDMGASNRAMWRSFGVTCGRNCKTQNKIPHPEAPGKWLYFLADVPHVFKNIKSAVIRGNTFTLSDTIVEKYHLKSKSVNVDPLNDLARFQENLDLKVAPKLTIAALKPNQFEKMKVSFATRVLSHEVSCGLKYLVDKEGRKEEYLTAAWLIEVISHWFQLMTSRHPVLALSRMDPKKYDEAVNFLRDVIQIFRTMKIGSKGDWKPIQTGVIMSTTSVLEIAEELLDNNHSFLLTSRLTQDCLENLFSLVRLRKPVPSLLDFKYALKTVSTAQFLTPPCTGSYEKDDGEFLAEFLDNKNCKSPCESEISINFINEGELNLSVAESNSLYNLIGYCVHSIKNTETTCAECLGDVIASPHETPHKAADLTLLKEYKKGGLVSVSDKAYEMLHKVEVMFRKSQSVFIDNNNNLKEPLMDEALNLTRDYDIHTCHNLKNKLLSKFIDTRLRFFCRKTNEEQNSRSMSNRNVDLSSKSVAMRKLAHNIK